MALITHAHDDHYGGFNYLCREPGGGHDFSIENIYYSVFRYKAYGRFWDCLESLIRESTFASQVSARGPPISPDNDIEINVLYPFKKIPKPSQDKNDDSVVLQLRHRNTHFLFTGDASKKVERELLGQDIQSNVLKLGHHGSNTASAEEFLQRVKPLSDGLRVIISSNDKDTTRGNYGHPHKETLDSLRRLGDVKLYRTDLQGTVVMVSDGDSIRVTTSTQKEIPEEALWKPGRRKK